jgi:hypothetical protein
MHCRDPRPEVQAKKVLLRKWKPASEPPSPEVPDYSQSQSTRFRREFKEPLTGSKRAAMRELFPGRRYRRNAAEADAYAASPLEA